MLAHSVTVIAPARLHFGLISFGHANCRQFGGVGVMIDEPKLRLRVVPAERLEVAGPLGERVLGYVERWSRRRCQGRMPACRIEVLAVPRSHVGLGVGTQLGLATARALDALHGYPAASARELAESVDRGLRSAVGTHGFDEGGFIYERGKMPGEVLAPLACRVPLPRSWRFVLVTPRAGEGYSGGRERQAFAELPPVPTAVSRELTRWIEQKLIPAARADDCDAFGEAVYEYGRLAGTCFASVQGGPYNGEALQHLVGRMRAAGAAGVGQSSWGPTIFAVASSSGAAAELVARLRRSGQLDHADTFVARVDNAGARLSLALSEQSTDRDGGKSWNAVGNPVAGQLSAIT